jgi:hypothetical protein
MDTAKSKEDGSRAVSLEPVDKEERENEAVEDI